jgi:SAM-dependent methyltransferase
MDAAVYDQLRAMEERHWWFRGRRAVIWALIRRAGFAGGGRLLDAGCGTGRNLVELGHLAAAEGVDSSAVAIECCRRRGLDGVRIGSLDALPFEASRFDLLLATDVLEHLADDDAGLRELHRVAAPGGILVITVPAYGWLWSQHDETHHHHRRYTRRLLTRRAERAGWAVELATYFNTALLPPIAAGRRLRRSAGDARNDYELTGGLVNSLLEWPMRAEAALIARGGTLPAGVSIGMVCRRAVGHGVGGDHAPNSAARAR